MPDTFTESFNSALNLAHSMENNAQVRKYQQMQMQMQMQVQGAQLQQMAQKMAQESELVSSFKDIETVTPRQMGEPIQPGQGEFALQAKPGLETVNIPTKTKTPEMESLLAQYPTAYRPFAERAARTRNWELLEKIPKIKEDKEAVDEVTIWNTKTRETKRIYVPKILSSEYQPPKGWQIGTIPAPEKPEKPDKPTDFDKKWTSAKKIAKKYLVGKEPDDEAIANQYRKMFGTESLLQALLGGSITPTTSNIPKYDAQGNRIK